ncbi:MAG: lipopolysaccharide biosynthesis protein RfbH [Pseudomonadota bacterium]|uniref:lipopolysaccharide biosynthesis protein RfbH n=1 Tax=Methylophaga aminisulfidivorans TaxID=230105 RepID=UPI0024E25A63|nr:lipopolysaccharide biosynthesis protein RfbH [Methylophaga aminisulfidivorans]MEC9412110.1 lipopolysaccharide biosynthesis protein RfbH [Pseudomonadota bacterium]
MNPLHTPHTESSSIALTSGDICVVNKTGMSPTLCVVVAIENATIECYEILVFNDDVSDLDIFVFDDDSVNGSARYVDLRFPLFVGSLDVASYQGKISTLNLERLLRALVQRQVKRYSQTKFLHKDFLPGSTAVPVSGKVMDSDDIEHLVDASLDGWLTTGRFNAQFEKALAEFIGIKHVLTVNSGSSANLLALTALTSPKLGDKALQKGDEVITVAAGFPTTVNPILQNGLVPVFVDITLPSYNIDVSQLEVALSDKTRAIMMAHTLGNTFNIDAVVAFARQHNLWLIEDCCDALGTTYSPVTELTDYRGQVIALDEPRHVGTFGDIATLSFYPAHHITMGEGGAVYTNNGQLKLILESFRDWGRDCFCEPGQDNTCKKRFSYQLGQLPCGYDHKYTYSHLGYNLKISDMQAAVGLSQLAKVAGFIEKRKANFQRLYAGLSSLQDYLLLPEAENNADPSWFGFAITLKQSNRADFIQYLEQHKIANRLVFGGNLIKQPYFEQQSYRKVGELTVTDHVMNDSLWLGVFPGLSDEMIDYMIDTIQSYFKV